MKPIELFRVLVVLVAVGGLLSASLALAGTVLAGATSSAGLAAWLSAVLAGGIVAARQVALRATGG